MDVAALSRGTQAERRARRGFARMKGVFRMRRRGFRPRAHGAARRCPCPSDLPDAFRPRAHGVAAFHHRRRFGRRPSVHARTERPYSVALVKTSNDLPSTRARSGPRRRVLRTRGRGGREQRCSYTHHRGALRTRGCGGNIRGGGKAEARTLHTRKRGPLKRSAQHFLPASVLRTRRRGGGLRLARLQWNRVFSARVGAANASSVPPTQQPGRSPHAQVRRRSCHSHLSCTAGALRTRG